MRRPEENSEEPNPLIQEIQSSTVPGIITQTAPPEAGGRYQPERFIVSSSGRNRTPVRPGNMLRGIRRLLRREGEPDDRQKWPNLSRIMWTGYNESNPISEVVCGLIRPISIEVEEVAVLFLVSCSSLSIRQLCG